MSPGIKLGTLRTEGRTNQLCYPCSICLGGGGDPGSSNLTTENANTWIRWKLMEPLDDLLKLHSKCRLRKPPTLRHSVKNRLKKSAERRRESLIRSIAEEELVDRWQGEVVDFGYLGAVFSNKGGANKDMQNWLVKAKSPFGRHLKFQTAQ